MKIISEAKKTIATYWGKGKRKDAEYRLMRYHIRTDCEDGTLLLNTVTGEMVLLSPEETAFLEQLPAKPNDQVIDLIEHRFLVPTDFDEMKSVKQLRAIFRKMDVRKGITGYSILPTSACNARCFYCFESGYPQVTMTPETADRVAEYIEKNCCNQKVQISWFGGEPMVGHKIISRICEGLTQKGIKFQSSMYSNGLLFTDALVDEAKNKWNLQSIQITLDGSEDVYNKTKNYVGFVGNPYYRVLDNIGLLIDRGIRVIVRLNLDFHNSDDLTILIDELTERFFKKKGFSIYVNELFEDEGFCPVHHTREEQRQLADIKVQLESYIVNKLFSDSGSEEAMVSELPTFKYRFCMADSPNSVLINPRGELGKCDHYSFERLIGSISTTESVNECIGLGFWLEPEEMDYCNDCALFPYCSRPSTCDSGANCREESKMHQLSAFKNSMIQCYGKSVAEDFTSKEAIL